MFVELGLSIGIFKVWQFLNSKDERKIKNFINEKNIINKARQKPKVKDIELFHWGLKVTLDIAGICSFEDIEKHEDYLRQLFKAKEIVLSNSEGKVFFEIINNPVLEKEYTSIELPSTSLLFGFDNKGEPIVGDMLITPHVGIQGISNCGKTKMVELMLRNLNNADFVLLNVMQKDFKKNKALKRINNFKEIEEYLNDLVDNKHIRERPLYLVFDELNVLGKEHKGINNAIAAVLSQARHFNIFLIALGQSLLKEDCPYKQRFNVKVSFTASTSAINAFIDTKIEKIELQQREFIYKDGKVKRGKSYKYDFNCTPTGTLKNV